MQLSDLSLRLHALSVLRGVLRLPLVNAYAETLSAFDRSAADFADRYGALCAARFACGDIPRSFLNAVHFDVNTLTDTIDAPADALLAAATHDIEVLNGLLALSGSQLCEAAALHFDADALRSLPDFAPSAALPFTTGAELAGYYRSEGYGFFAQSSAFSMQDDGSALPIVHPDTIRLHDLPGYERQKKQVLQNTRAFLDGKDANNILLYGDKGTGKSSTVKAVANEYADRGLKIIQMSPRHITCFPKLFEQTLRSPFRFIVFLDDLTFDREDDNFAALKAFIEGGARRQAVQPCHLRDLQPPPPHPRKHGRPSGRRRPRSRHARNRHLPVRPLRSRDHLLRSGQGRISVHRRAARRRERSCARARDELHLLAERFALRRNGRSPRTARQFISQQLAEQYGNA